MLPRSPLLLLVALAAMAGCGDPCADPSGGSVTLGSGPDGFVDVADGAMLQVAWGGQGGQHVWASAEWEGLVIGRGESTLEVGLDHPEGSLASYGPTLITVPPGRRQLTDLTAELIPPSPERTPSLYPDGFSTEPDWPTDEQWQQAQAMLDAGLAEQLTFWATLTDACGQSATDSRQVGIQGISAQDYTYR